MHHSKKFRKKLINQEEIHVFIERNDEKNERKEKFCKQDRLTQLLLGLSFHAGSEKKILNILRSNLFRSYLWTNLNVKCAHLFE